MNSDLTHRINNLLASISLVLSFSVVEHKPLFEYIMISPSHLISLFLAISKPAMISERMPSVLITRDNSRREEFSDHEYRPASY